MSTVFQKTCFLIRYGTFGFRVKRGGTFILDSMPTAPGVEHYRFFYSNASGCFWVLVRR